LCFEELEDLSEEIRILVTNGRGYTIREYIMQVEALKGEDLGYRICRALIHEPKLESYFSDAVFEALQNRARKEHYPIFNKEDDEFMERNIYKGIEWLKNRFYTNVSIINDRIDVLDLRSELSVEDIIILERHKDELGA